MTYREKLFICLPHIDSSKCENETEKVIQELEKRIKQFSNDEKYKTSIAIAKLIINRLTSSNPQLKWERKDYGVFKQNLCLCDDSNLKLSLSTIIACLAFPNELILNDLELISKKVRYYPFTERKLDPFTKIYEIKEIPIEATDCYKLINILYKNMRGQISQTVRTLYSSDEDIEIVYETLYNSIKNNENNICDTFIKQFDAEYAFLKNTLLFSNVYIQFKEKYFSFFLQELTYIYSQYKLQKDKETPRHRNALAVLEARKEKRKEKNI